MATSENQFRDALKQSVTKIKSLMEENARLKQKSPIAIVGMGLRFPGEANTPGQFWENLKNGVDSVLEVPKSRWDTDLYFDPNPEVEGKTYNKWSGLISDVDLFDNLFFEISPKEAAEMDPQQRILLEVSWEALENAGLNLNEIKGSLTGTYLGIHTRDHSQAKLACGLNKMTPHSLMGNAFSVGCGRVSYFYDFHGPSVPVDTACASTATAMHSAVTALNNKEVDMALAGGVNLLLTPDGYIGLCKINSLSRSSHCRAFDAGADGFIRSEGCGIFVLKRLDDAIASNDNILGVISGVAVGQDGKSNGIAAPNGVAQENIIRKAMSYAGLNPEDIDYVETHGTGTPLGDPVEVGALTKIFKERKAPLYIGSVKTNLGHLESAAGAASLAKTILSLNNKFIPKSLHFENPNELIPWKDIPVSVVKEGKEWKSNGKKRIAGVSAFGYNGSISHLIVEEAPERSSENTLNLPNSIFTLSAKNEYSLVETMKSYLAYLEQTPDSIQDICYTANISRAVFKRKLAITAKSREDLAKKIRACLDNPERAAMVMSDKSALNKKLVFMFTGQGSQYFEMAKGLYDTHPVFKQELTKCAELAAVYLKSSIIDVLYKEDFKSEMEQAQYAQPVIFAVEYSLAKLLLSFGFKPSLLIGHSIGEYAAACIAGVFSLETAIKMVCLRGKLMQKETRKGKMAGILTNEAKVKALMEEIENVSIAAINAPNNVTISGDEDAVDELLKRVKSQKIFTENLNITHAFHSVIVEPQGKAFYQEIKDLSFHKPKIPIIADLTGELANEDIATPLYWSRHIYSTLQFSKAITTAEEIGYEVYVELGGTATLTGLAAQCSSKPGMQFLPTLRKGREAWQQLNETIARLYLEDVTIDWQKYHQPFDHKKVILPNYKFNRKSYPVESYPELMATGLQGASLIGETMKKPESTVLTSFPDSPLISPVQTETVAASQTVPTQQTTSKRSLEELLTEVKEMIGMTSGLEMEEIDDELNLFSLGLDSLMLVQFLRKVEQKFELDIPINTVLTELSNVKSIAEYISDNAAEHLIATTVAPPVAALPQLETKETVSGAVSSHPGNGEASVSGMRKEMEAILKETPNQEILYVFDRQFQLMEKQIDAMRTIAIQSAEKTGTSSAATAAQPPQMKGVVKAKEDAPSGKKAEVRLSQPGMGNNRGIKSEEDMLSHSQMAFVKDFISSYIKRAPKSKEFAREYRDVMADWINSLNFRLTLKEILFPIVPEKMYGARFQDIDGNEYLDLGMGRGANFLGHNPPYVIEAVKEQLEKGFGIGSQHYLTGELARLIKEMTGCERVAFSNTGTEAVMHTLRLVRAVTGKLKVIKFAGAYHGTFDGVLAEGDEKEIYPMAPGTSPGMVEDLLVLNYGTKETLEIIKAQIHEVAAVLVEPVQSRNPTLQPVEFLKELRQITAENDVPLIFDEMINGFRIHQGGAQAYFGIEADICTYGKIPGGGMPIGIIAGKTKYLNAIDGGVWQYGNDSVPESITTVFGGTFCKHPIAMASAYAALKYMKEKGPELQHELNEKTNHFVAATNAFFEQNYVPIKVSHFASQFRFQSTGKYDLAFMPIEMELFFALLMTKGIYTWERRINTLSVQHTKEDLDLVLHAIKESIFELRQGGFSFSTKDAFGETPAQVCYPMSSHQKRLYTLCQFEDAEKAYHITNALILNGEIHIGEFEKALQDLIKRHASLRTSFRPAGDEVFQVVCKEAAFTIDYIDAQGQDAESIVKNYVKPFDLDHGPLMRVCFAKLSVDSHLLILDIHHIIADGYSINVLVPEILQLYLGNKLPAPSAPYLDYVKWEKGIDHSLKYKKQESYWLSKLSGEVPILELPLDFSRPAMQDFSGKTIRFKFEEDKVKKIKSFARKNQATVYMVMLTAFDIMLHKITTMEDILVGTPVALRPEGKFDTTIGMFTNTVVLRAEPKGDKSVQALLNEVKSDCLQSFSNQEYLFDDLVEKIGNKKDHSRNPLFSAMFVYERADDRVVNLDSLSVKEYNFAVDHSFFDLTLEVIDAEGKFNISINYADKLFLAENVGRWKDFYIEIVNQMIEEPIGGDGKELLLKDINILDQVEMDKVLHSFNDTQCNYPSTKTLVDLFEEQVAHAPDKVAIVSGQKGITYNELDVKSNLLTHYLSKKGVGPEHLVAICMERSEEMVVGILGIMKAGGAYLPIDSSYPKERIDYMLQDAKVAIVISNQKESKLLEGRESIELIKLDTDWEKISKEQKSSLATKIEPGNLAYVIYTSGSTGKPKGGMLEHRNVVNYVSWAAKKYLNGESGNFPLYTSIAFDLTVTSVFVPLLTGNTIHVYETEEHDPLIERVMREGKVEIVKATPSHMKMLLQNPDISSSVKRIILGGEDLSRELAQDIADTFRNDIEIYNEYGPTETAVGCMIYQFKADQHKNRKSLPIGRPADNVKLYILDKHLQIVPIGVKGELYIGGDGVGRGYLYKEALSQERFIQNPFHLGRMYKTGDLARWMFDGNMEFLGRADDQVKIRGYRIELSEVEHVLQKAPGVANCVVMTQKDAQGSMQLLGYVVARETYTKEAVLAFMKASLPAYMVPSFLVELDEIPLTANGKVNKKLLPAFDIANLLSTNYVDPRNETEDSLAKIWQYVLGLEKVSVLDDFFEVGGHSLKATQLALRISKEMGIQVRINEIFTYPTLEKLAGLIETKKTTEDHQAIQTIEKQPFYDVSHAQHRLWVLSQFEQASLSYNMPAAFKITGSFNKEILEEAFNKLLERHEIVRTSFTTIDNQLKQVVHDQPLFSLKVENCSPEELNDKMMAYAQHKFDLSHAPLLKVKLLKTSETEHTLLLNMHHIISDGWSVNIFVKDLVIIYNSLKKGVKANLPVLAIQYKDYAHWQNNRLNSNETSASREYWLKNFEGEIPVLELPADFNRPKVISYQGSTVNLELNSRQLKGLKRLAKDNGASLFMVLLAAVKTLLYRYTGQEDIVIGTPIAGRNHVDLDYQIGFYVNTLALRSQLNGTTSFKGLLGMIKDCSTQAYDHQQYPFDQLVDDLQLSRNTSRNPLFDVMVVLQNNDVADFNFEDLAIEEIKIPSSVSKFDLTFSFEEEKGRLLLELEYNSDIYKQERIEQLGVHLNELIKGIVAAPEEEIRNFNYLTKKENRLLLKRFNQTEVLYPAKETLVSLFAEQVAKTPDKRAIVFEGKSLSYKELDEQSNQLAHYLIKNGAKPESLVGICLERSLHMSVGLWGILKAGAAYVPIDPAYPEDRINFLLEDSKAEILISTVEQAAKLPASPSVKLILLDSENDLLKKESLDQAAIEIVPSNLAYVIYTSGSTGTPKGVMIEHGSIVNRLRWAQDYFQLSTEDAVLQKTTFCFDVSVWELFWPLLVGARLVFARPEGHKDVDYLKKVIGEEQISILHFVPSMLTAFLEQIKKGDCKALQKVLCSGEALKTHHAEAFNQKFPLAGLHNLYGPTEAAVDVSYWSVPKDFDKQSIVPIGKPVANTSLYVLDKAGNLLPAGIPGELHIGGVQVARGYLNRDTLTKEKFIPNPFSKLQDDKLYKTGDTAYWLADGNLVYLGRNDDQVKIRGYRIELGEVEHVLQKAPGVANCVVIAQKDAQGSMQLLGYVVARETYSKEAVLAFMKASLPAYMVPSFLVELDEIPLTANGKVNKKALPAFDIANLLSTNYVAPRNELETTLAEIWGEALRLEKVGINDNFFEIGGDSIKAIQITSRLMQKGLSLPLQSLFAFPTIEQLSHQVKEDLIEVDQEPVVGELKLLPIQQWFFANHTKGLHHFNQSVMLSKESGFDKFLLEKVLQELTIHHDALRITFKEKDGWSQYNNEAGSTSIELAYHVVDPVSEDEIAALAEKVQASIDLTDGPLMKAALFHTPSGDYLLLVIHHLIIDVVSWRILLEDLLLLYQQVENNKEPHLIQKTHSYLYWAEKLHEYAQSNSIQLQASYWEKIENTSVNSLTKDFDSPVNTMEDRKAIQACLAEEETEALMKNTHHAYNTEMNDLLLSALGLSLKGWQSLDKALVNMEGHGREEIFPGTNTSRTVGWFTSLFPVLLDLSGEQKDVATHIKKTKEALRRVPDKGIGYGIWKYLTKKDSSANESEITFNYLGELDHENAHPSGITLSAMPTGNAISPEMESNTSLEMNCQITKGRFEVHISYNSREYKKETIESFSSLYLSNLRNIIQHCGRKEKSEYTPSDFGDQQLSFDELQNIQNLFE